MHGFTRHVENVRALSRKQREEAATSSLHQLDAGSTTSSCSSSARRSTSQRATARNLPANAAATLAAAVSQAVRPESRGRAATSSRLRNESPAAEDPEHAEVEKRKSANNKESMAWQKSEIQKVIDKRITESSRNTQQQLRRQYKAHTTSSFVPSSKKDPDAKCSSERSGKPGLPRILPKLPPSSLVNVPANQTLTKASEELLGSTTGESTSAGSTPTRRAESRNGSMDSGASKPTVDKSHSSPPGEDSPQSVTREPLPHEKLACDTPTPQGASDEQPGESVPEEAADSEVKEESKQTDGGTRQKGSLQTFLDRQKLGLSMKICTSLSEWKRHNHCVTDRKVFACCGGYPDFRDALLRRGWFQNPNKDSPHFDLKWGMVTNINHENLQQHQIVNHFDKCRDLTTKVGLTLALRSSVQLTGRTIDSFYPRAFDLYDPGDRADFVLDYKLTKAESILRRFLEHVDGDELMTFSQDVIHEALKICLRMVTDVDDVIDCDELAEGLGTVPANEWKLLQKVNLDHVLEGVETIYTKAELEELIQKKANTSGKAAILARAASKEKEKDQDKNRKASKKKKRKKETEEVSISAAMDSYNCPRGKYYIQRARETLAEMEAANLQHCINGSRNAWIVKPSGKSRGRGIQMLRELDEIFRVTETDGFQWICQKYIEQPQLIHGYKFDIRQWVLVTDWNPLTFYVWKQPYVRFAGQKYDSSCEDNSAYMHLVNNSIIKNMDGFDKINEDLNASGYMWFRQQYQEWLHSSFCKCEKHHTPWLTPPPYTCETFGVNWEDVKFIAKDEDDEDDDGDEADPVFTGPATFPSASAAPTTGSAPSPCQSPECIDSERQSMQTGGDQDVANHGTTPEERAGDDTPACEDIWMTRIKPQIVDIILSSLRCVSDSVQHRKNTTELFGYDFMLSSGKDDPAKVWLIEVNSSPACDYSTPVTCPLVKQMMEDTAKVMIDMRDDPKVHTGEWELIDHEHSKYVPTKKNCPINLEVSGTRIKPPKGWKKKNKKKKTVSAAAKAKDKAQNEDEEEDECDAEDEEDDDDDEAERGRNLNDTDSDSDS